MKLAILWSLSILLLTLFHLGFQAPEAPISPISIKMQHMLEECISNPWEYLETKLVTCGHIEASLVKELGKTINETN